MPCNILLLNVFFCCNVIMSWIITNCLCMKLCPCALICIFNTIAPIQTLKNQPACTDYRSSVQSGSQSVGPLCLNSIYTLGFSLCPLKSIVGAKKITFLRVQVIYTQIGQNRKNGKSLHLGWSWPDRDSWRLFSDSVNSLNVTRCETTNGFYSDLFYALSFSLFFYHVTS